MASHGQMVQLQAAAGGAVPEDEVGKVRFKPSGVQFSQVVQAQYIPGQSLAAVRTQGHIPYPSSAEVAQLV